MCLHTRNSSLAPLAMVEALAERYCGCSSNRRATEKVIFPPLSMLRVALNQIYICAISATESAAVYFCCKKAFPSL